MDLIEDYPFTIGHLGEKSGGEFIIECPDLPGYKQDAETIDKAMTKAIQQAC